MLYIEQIKIKENYLTLQKDRVIELKPLTVIVGEQGCGKSTLLRLLNKNSDKIEVKLCEYLKNDYVDTFYFDTETMNPRISDINNYTTMDGRSKGIGVGAALQSHFQSHGEVLREFTVNRINDAKNCILFLDEPESALSLKNQFLLSKRLIDTTTNNKTQIILATHCLPIISSVEEVFDLVDYKWKNSTEYINEQK